MALGRLWHCLSCSSLRSEVGKFQSAPAQTACVACVPGRYGIEAGLSSPACSGSDGSFAPCPVGFEEFHDGDHDFGCFLHVAEEKSADDARAHCAALGADLASFHSAPTQGYLSELCQAADEGQEVSAPHM